MGRVALENKDLLKMIEQGMSAQEICKKAQIDMNTLKRRHHNLMINEKRYIELQGFDKEKTTIRRKRMGILINNRMLDILKVKDRHMQEYKAIYKNGDIIISKI